MKKNIILAIAVFFLSGSIVSAGTNYYTDVEEFQKYNPDGEKYQFVKMYITSLIYLNKNAYRQRQLPEFDADLLDDLEGLQAFIDHLVLSNVNLHVAKNLIKKYRIPENGLILKVSDSFVTMCEQQIELNQREKQLMEGVIKLSKNDQLEKFDKEKFLHEHKKLAFRRKESLKDLLESSILVNVVLISDKTNIYGEFVRLGITQEERYKLLNKLYDFYGDEFEGSLREGQTFLEGSITTIRERLEDPSWDTLDDWS